MNARPLDVQTLPLQGWQVIEASAGTGKTWTLAALYLRLILGHGRRTRLLPDQILVMTFTEAATAELRERIQRRLEAAARWFEAAAGGSPLAPETPPDPLLDALAQDIPRAEWPSCALQLRAASQAMDLAAIETIHGWARRTLQTHAVASRSQMNGMRLDDPDALWRMCVQDYWRAEITPLPLAELQTVRRHFKGTPDTLAPTLLQMWRRAMRAPDGAERPSCAPAEVFAQQTAYETQLQTLAQTARAAWHAGVLSALQAHRIPKARQYEDKLQTLSDWCTSADDGPEEAATPEDTEGRAWRGLPPKKTLTTLESFGARSLAAKKWPGDLTAHPFFQHLQAYLDALAQLPDLGQALRDHAMQAVAQRYQQRKEALGCWDFDDLLQQLHTALNAPEGELAPVLRAQYPVALVDEFQDTDRWQYGSLAAIYAPAGDHAFIMIGDPKQAIYGFRGADIHTYLAARDAALARDPKALHTLETNRRSCDGLVRAVNHLFAVPQVFGDDAQQEARIQFHPVAASAPVASWSQRLKQERPALTVWYRPHDGKKASPRELLLEGFANSFADQMAQLLNAGLAKPREMAVLVRQQDQARAMRDALAARRIPSVYRSAREPVVQTQEAQDIWCLLEALAHPRERSALRAALASRTWCLPLEAVEACIQDEAQWDALVMQCQRWQDIGQRQGVLPMLVRWLIESGAASRLLQQAEPERSLSHVLHLGELLQAQANPHDLAALARWLGEQTLQPSGDTDGLRVRLETDAECVQILTYHMSKGLQFPMVFLPFVGLFSARKDPKDDDEGAQSTREEDMRLLYVAMTRAQEGLWMGVCESHQDVIKGPPVRLSALSRLLERQQAGDLWTQLVHRCQHPDISLAELPEPTGAIYQAPAADDGGRAARTPKRTHMREGGSTSFSALTRGLETTSAGEEALADALTDAQDAPEPGKLRADLPWQGFPAGARYGTLLHDLLEWQAQQDWPLARDTVAPWQAQAWRDWCQRKTLLTPLKADAQAQLEPWLRELITCPLSLEGTPLQLSALQADAIWPEMGFSLPTQAVRADDLDAWVQQAIWRELERPALKPQQLEGLLTGFMDLVFCHAGRYWVMDYKSNRLEDYNAPTLQQAMVDKRYDLQAVLYVLALHRLLRARLPGYDYSRHMGGAAYWFVRGARAPGEGLITLRPPQSLLVTLDDSLGAPAQAHSGAQP